MASFNWPSGASAGSVSGPGSATNNAAVRFDGTTGGIVQNSLVVIDDSGNVTGVNDLTVDNDTIITGDLTVNGTTTTVNTATLDVTDANITVNNTGTQATANSNNAGITVEMSDATDAEFGYDSTAATFFKVGEVGSVVEVADISTAQTLTNKTLDADNNTISNLAHGTEVDNPTSGVHGATGTIVGTSDSQSLTNKTIDADLNTITNIVNADVKAAAAIDYSKLNLSTSILNADVNASAAIAYSKLDLTTSVDNGDINASAAIALSKLAATTVSRALVSDGSGFVSPATTTSTEIGYVNGVTSALQTQLNGKQKDRDIDAAAGTSGVTIVSTDEDVHIFTNTAGITVKLNNSFLAGRILRIVNNGTRDISLTANDDAVIRNIYPQTSAEVICESATPTTNTSWTSLNRVVSNWASDYNSEFSVQNFGTTTEEEFYWKRDGNELEVYGSWKAGTLDTATAAILFANLDFDSALVNQNAKMQRVGTYSRLRNTATNIYSGNAAGDMFTSDAVTGRIDMAISATTFEYNSSNDSDIGSASERFSVSFKVPISGWGGLTG